MDCKINSKRYNYEIFQFVKEEERERERERERENMI